jgi:signal transduction histidine kinase
MQLGSWWFAPERTSLEGSLRQEICWNIGATGAVKTVAVQVVDGTAQVIVRDQGMGIADEHLPHIFKRFYRAAPDPNEESRSGGLGLAIAEAIIHAHHGTINCVSKVGEGSAFTLRFPLGIAIASLERVGRLV